jgi:hypothetical protein
MGGASLENPLSCYKSIANHLLVYQNLSYIVFRISQFKFYSEVQNYGSSKLASNQGDEDAALFTALSNLRDDVVNYRLSLHAI